MKHYRTKIDAGVFSDILPEGCELYKQPELPRIEFKSNGIKYTFTDLRLLNQSAIGVFEYILEAVMNTPDCKEISFNAENIDEDTISIVTDILLGISYTAKKGGKNGFQLSGRILVSGVRRKGKTLTFELLKSKAKIIYKYAQESQKNGAVSLSGIIIALANDTRENFARQEENDG